MEIVTTNHVLSQIDLKVMRVVCKDWLQLINSLWKDYVEYANKRAMIYTVSPKDLLYINSKFYIRKPNFNLLNAEIFPLIKGKTNNPMVSYKCCNCSNHQKLGICENRHADIGIVYDSKIYQGYEIYPEKDIYFRLEQQVKESDIILLPHHYKKNISNDFYICHNEKIIQYDEGVFYPLETHNINYFGKNTRLCDKKIIERPKGYLVDYTNIIDSNKNRYIHILNTYENEYPEPEWDRMDSDPEEENINIDIGYPEKQIAESLDRYYKNLENERKAAKLENEKNKKIESKNKDQINKINETNSDEDDNRPWDEGVPTYN
jgi:hypothetical protein